MKKIILSILIAMLVPSLGLGASDINQQLYDAAYELNVGKVQALLNSGADPNWFKPGEREGTSILKWASYKARLDEEQAQKKLLKIATILFEKGAKLGPHDNDILYVPIAYGAHDLTQLYIRHGASPIKFSSGTGSNITPVELAAQNGHTDIQKLLVEHGAAKLDTKTVIQLQFIYKALFGTVPELEDLIKQGAKVNAKNRLGETALIDCLRMFSSSRAPVFFYLLDIGADVNLKGHDSYWETFPLHVAIEWTSYTLNFEKPRAGEKEMSKKILNSLIKAGAYVSSRNERGQTPLHVAAKYKNLFAARLLLKHNSKVMPRDGEGNTPLDYAESGDIIKILKDHGAKEF